MTKDLTNLGKRVAEMNMLKPRVEEIELFLEQSLAILVHLQISEAI
jgi:hypothetical protein